MHTDQNNASHPGAILVAHLEPNMRIMLKEVLELEGYDVQATAEGSEAVDILHRNAQGMILFLEPLFLHLEELKERKGLQDLIMSRRPQDRHVVILLSGMLGIERLVRDVRADGYLPLPFNLDQLLAVVEDAQRVLRFKQAWPLTPHGTAVHTSWPESVSPANPLNTPAHELYETQA